MDYVARTPQQLGQVLKACRKRRKLTQTTVGSRVGVRQAQISSIETHGADITVDTLYKLLSALGLELVLREMQPRGSKSEW
jgi:HTH-type transcriptional regulator / antitoxin HipB